MSLQVFVLDALRFNRVLREVNPPGAEKLVFLSPGSVDERLLAHYVATEPTDHLLLVQKQGAPEDTVLFITQYPEHRRLLADAIRKVLKVGETPE